MNDPNKRRQRGEYWLKSFGPTMLKVVSLIVPATVVPPLAVLGQANYATPYTFITIAGAAGAAGSADGTNRSARFNGPYGEVVDSAGKVYVADGTNGTIRRVTPVGTSWVVTTLAGKAGVNGSADGTNSGARFYGPAGPALDGAGNIYVADCGNSTVRKLTPVGTNWVVTTLAGLAGYTNCVDGTNNDARFCYPNGVAVDSATNVYVADTFNNTIRRMTLDGTNWVVTTLAGKAGVVGSADGTNSAARFYYPDLLAVDGAGNLYVPDTINCTIRKVTPDGTNWVVTTLAGKAGVAGSADGTNSAARFYYPNGVAVDSATNVYVADQDHTIRKLTPVGTNWVVTTLAGRPGVAGSTDGTGSTALFSLGGISGSLAVDIEGNVYVGDVNNNTIRKGMPASSVPAPLLNSANLSGGMFGFGITGLPGLAVNIESSTDLSSWQVARTFVLQGGMGYYSVIPNQAVGAQFYRIQVR